MRVTKTELKLLILAGGASAFAPEFTGFAAAFAPKYPGRMLVGGSDSILCMSGSYLDQLVKPSSFWSSETAPAGPQTSYMYTKKITKAQGSGQDKSGVSGGSELPTMNKLTLDAADKIANGVIACIKRNNFNPIAVSVVDEGAHVIVQKRMNGCPSVGYAQFAYAKAYTCIVQKESSRDFRDKYTLGFGDNPAKYCQMMAMVDITGGKMAPFPGGVLILNSEGSDVIGAVGVSGAAGDEDEYCAIRAVVEAELGVKIKPEKHSCSTTKENL
jgi:uncharacterized protein GlcG (DUF336 family)